jgi:WD40 repeat protein
MHRLWFKRKKMTGNSERHLVVTVHGIRTFGGWQERLEVLLRATDPEINVINYKYGYFSVVAFLVPFLRWLVVRRFRIFLQEISSDHNWDRIDLVGHSFGTHIIGWALYQLSHSSSSPIHTVLLAASVLKSGFPWNNILRGTIKRLVNDCSTRDNILLMSQLGVLFTGMAGRLGFNGGTGRNFRNRFFDWGHGGYFLQGGLPYDSFMQRYWVPLLTTEQDPELYDARSGSPVNGLLTTLLNNAELIKLTIYMAPVVAFSIWISGLYLEAAKQRAQAQHNLEEAKRNLNSMLQNQSRYVAEGVKSSIETDPERALALTLQVLPYSLKIPHRPMVPEALSVAIKAAAADRLRGVLVDHSADIRSAAYNNDGTKLVTAAEDNTARVWDARTGVVMLVLNGHTDVVDSAVFSPDGERVLTASHDRTARVWDTATGKALMTISGHHGWVVGAEFDPSGEMIVTTSLDHTARIWNSRTGALISELRGSSDNIGTSTFSPNGKLVVAVPWDDLTTDDRTGYVWDVATGTIKASLRKGMGKDVITSAAFNPSSNIILTGASDGTALLWNTTTGTTIASLKRHSDSISVVAFNNDGSKFLTGSYDYAVIIWDTKTLRPIFTLIGHSGAILTANFSRDGHKLVTSSRDGSVRIWDTDNGATVAVLDKFPKFGRDYATFNPDATRVVTYGRDSKAYIWDASRSSTREFLLQGHRAEVKTASYSEMANV